MAAKATTTAILITGANRGIGRGLTAAYLSRPSTTVIAAVRNPSHPTSQSLSALPHGPNSTLILTKIDSSSHTDALSAIQSLRENNSIEALDIVIANAAIANVMPAVSEARPEDMAVHYHVNVIAPVLLFQAVLPLLLKGKSPRFVAVSSAAGSIGAMVPFPHAAYGPSKVALNWLARKIHFEQPGIIAFPVNPGWVQTDMGNNGAVMAGIPSGKGDITVDESVAGLTALIDGATREKTSGRFWEYYGEEIAW